jgi:hypothetical protein
VGARGLSPANALFGFRPQSVRRCDAIWSSPSSWARDAEAAMKNSAKARLGTDSPKIGKVDTRCQ